MSVHKVGDLVEQQVRRWERVQAEASGGTSGPSVAISRMPFAGAGELATRVASRLDFGLFGREIVDQIAAEEGVSRTLVAGLDERAESAIERHVLDGFSRREFTESDYLRDAVRIVSTLGMRGRTVVLGRGGASILPAANTLRVLVVAAGDVRAKRLAEVEGVSPDEAVERLERADGQRREFWKRNFDADYLDPTRYDVVVNSGQLAVETCVDIIGSSFGGKFSR